MIAQVLADLEANVTADQQDVKNAFGNSHLLASCLKLLAQFQSQTRLVTKPSALYDKYALNINRALKHQNPQVRKEGEALLMEGYTDVLMCHLHGLDRAVAGMGTAFTPRQALLLKRFATRVVLVYDGDDAGQAAAGAWPRHGTETKPGRL